MPVRVGLGGTERKAEDIYACYQSSGGASDVPREMAGHMDQGKVHEEAGDGDWIIVLDGTTYVEHIPPAYETGRTGPGGFGFGGLQAKIHVLNTSYTADRTFTVEQTPTGEWKTTVDDRVVEHSEFRPFYVFADMRDGGVGGEGGFL